MFRKHLIQWAAVVVTAVAVLVVSVGAAAATSPAERALQVRSQALDAKYGLQTVSPAEIAAAKRALELRGIELNRLYGLDGNRQKAASSGSGFDWSAFGIGAAAMLGFVLLTAGVVISARVARTTSPVDFA